MNIGKQIQIIRKENKITQQKMAEDLAVSRQAISKWESGKSIPDIENLMYISSLYSISLDSLVKDDPKVSMKVIADTGARKWHLANILFFVALLMNIVWIGYQHNVWQLGRAIAIFAMLAIDIWLVRRDRPFKRTGVQNGANL